MNNFETLHRTWEEAVKLMQDSDTKVRVRGVATFMNMFESECDNIHGKFFMHAYNQWHLQHMRVSAAECHQIACMTVKTQQSLHSDEPFDN